MDVLEYGIKLVDQLSPAAHTAAKASSELTAQLERSKRGLADQEKGLAQAKSQLSAYATQLRLANQLGDVAGHQKYTALLEDQKRKVFDLSAFMEAHRPVAQGYIDGLTKQSSAAEKAAESDALLGGALEGLAGPAGIAIGVVTALAGTFADLTLEGAKLALEQVELRDQLETTFDALGDGPGAGKATLQLFKDLEGPLGQTRQQLADWTKTYEALGITDLSGIRYQLTATASAQAIMGASGAQAYESITRKVQEAIETHHGLKIADKGLAALSTTGANVTDVANKMGISVVDLRNKLKAGTVDAQQFGDALAEAIIEKGRGPLENLRGDMGTILGHAHDLFGQLFDGVDPKPFTTQLQSLVTVLDESNPSAQAAKYGITSFLDEVFRIGGEALPIVKHFFLDLEIAALRSYIAIKPLVREWNAIGGNDVALKTVAQDFGLLAKYIQITAENTAYFVRLLAEAVKFGGQLSTLGLVNFDNIGKGFKGGAKASKAGEDAGAEMGQGTIKGLNQKLEVQSPSRVMMGIGRYTGLGFIGGVRETVPRARDEGSRLGFAAVSATAYSATGPSSGPAAAASSGQGPMIVHVGGLHFVGAPGQSWQDMTETAVAALFERIALQRGAVAA